MAYSLENIVRDENKVPISGALVYVYDDTGTLAALTNIGGLSISNPMTTDAQGFFQGFVEEQGFYRLEYRYGGKIRFRGYSLMGQDPILRAEEFADQAFAVASAASNYFPSQALGEAGTTTGQFFSHKDAGGVLVYRERTAGGSIIIYPPSTPPIKMVYIADPTANNTPIIQAALAEPGYAIVALPPGTIELNTPIQGVDDRLLMGSGKGQTILKLKPTFTYTGSNNAAIDVIGKKNFCVSDLTIKNEKIGWTPGGGFGVRLNGIRHRDCSDFYVERVDAYDVSGYAFFAQGTGTLAANTTRRATYRSCWAYNAHVDFEQMASTDILVEDCHARLGTGDIPSDAMFHPLLRSKNIHFQNCTGEDNGSGILIVSSTGPMSSITMDGCRIISNNFYAINITDNGVPANAIAGIKFDNTHFESLNCEGLNFAAGGPGAPMMISNCTFKVSRAVGTVGGFYLVRSENTRFSNCTIESYAGTTGATSSALGSDDAVYFDGALIASGVAGTFLLPIGSATKIHLSAASTVTPSAAQNSAVRVFFQGQTVATTISAGVSSRVDFTLPGPCLDSTKGHLSAQPIVAGGFNGVPAADYATRAEFTTGTPFVTVWIKGDLGGQTIAWQFTEKF